jgi:hypothetical protein
MESASIAITFKNGFTFLHAIVAQNDEQNKQAKNGNFSIAFLNNFTSFLNGAQLWSETNFRDCYLNIRLGKIAILWYWRIYNVKVGINDCN